MSSHLNLIDCNNNPLTAGDTFIYDLTHEGEEKWVATLYELDGELWVAWEDEHEDQYIADFWDDERVPHITKITGEEGVCHTATSETS